MGHHRKQHFLPLYALTPLLPPDGRTDGRSCAEQTVAVRTRGANDRAGHTK